MNTEFSLSDQYVSVGGDGMSTMVNGWAAKTVGTHYLIASAFIISLILIIIVLGAKMGAEKFNPTATRRMMTGDQWLQAEKMEAEGGQQGKSAFAQQVQSPGGSSFAYDPAAKASQPGSLSYQVLHSADFGCDKRTAVTDDAWAWMAGVAGENMEDRPKSDNDYSQILSGRK